MTDIARLGYQVESSQLAKGTAELNKHTAAAQKTEVATQKFERKVQNLALSQKQLIAAQRQLPMQFTDIFTSMQAGQPPLQVLLQQGGQLKDVFGGVGPALRATSRYVMGLVNPLTIAAAAVGTLAVAWSQMEERQNAIDRALIRSGKFTEEYAASLGNLATEMDEIAGVTAGSAAKAIAEVASVGRFTAEQLEIVARASETWRAATGDAIEDTVKDFMKLRDDPVKAVLELNRTYGFLTESTLEQIKTLEDQDRQVEASDLAIRALAGTLESRAPQMRDQVGTIAGGFRGLKSAATEAWDAIVSGIDDAATKLRNESPGMIGTFMRWANGDMARTAATAPRPLVDPTDAMLRPLGAPLGGVVDSDAAEKRIKAEQEWDRLSLSNLSKKEKLEREIADIRKTGLTAKKSEQEIEKEIANARARYAESLPKGGRKKREETDPTEALIKRLREQIALNEEQLKSEESLTATERMLVQVRTELERIGSKGSATNRKLVAELMEQAKATDIATQAAERKRAADEALTRQAAIFTQQAENQRRANEIDLLSMGRGGETVEMLRRQLDIQREFHDELKRLGDRSVAKDKETWDLMAENARRFRDAQLEEERRFQEERQKLMGDWTVGANKAFEDYVARAADIAGQSEQIWSNAFQSIEDSVVELATTGKTSFSDLINSISADITRFATKQVLSSILKKVMPGFGEKSEASALSSAAGELAASGATLVGAAAALSGSAAALAAAGIAGGASGGWGAFTPNTGGFESGGGGGSGGGWMSLIGSLVGAFGGGRAFGGDVRDGRYYRVGEGDKPELLNLGKGKQYLIPGDKGSVEPISGMQGQRSVVINQQITMQGRIEPRTAMQLAQETITKGRTAFARNAG